MLLHIKCNYYNCFLISYSLVESYLWLVQTLPETVSFIASLAPSLVNFAINIGIKEGTFWVYRTNQINKLSLTSFYRGSQC